MVLDHEIAQMLEAARASSGKGVGELSLADARMAYTTRYRARGIAVERKIETEDFTIPGDARIEARLYRAPGTGVRRPAVLYFHGGGFVLGDIEAYDNQSRMLAALSGADIVFVNYRLAPEPPFPAPVEDAIAALGWIGSHSADMGFDKRRIALAGDSAGGNLAINAALAARDREIPDIAALILLYPVTDFRPFGGKTSYPSIEAYGDGYFLDKSLMDMFARHYLGRSGKLNDPRVSPLLADNLAQLPPTTVITAGHDPLRDQGLAFFEALKAGGTSATYRCMEGMVHNFMGHAGISRGARSAFEEVAETLRRALR
ncbi:esterase/lipase [Nitratireductor aquibiodomus RA22]|uniref:Esterase/lipase n=1 Tax=Nitratireductor aquibiodomus RA22 TaxID=1189611 RepID=I5BVE6_9HYPH|nr:alpha/beta hydrolase [Nitratireductor aquibiodomus]EIM73548.1 esterase/lipase [Nitratireductor aquibiodomus RA22]